MNRALRIAQRVIRLLAGITLIFLVLLWLEELHYVDASAILTSSWIRAAIASWTIGISLSLPFVVGIEGWLIRRNKLKDSSYWPDLILAAACFVLLVSLILYSLSHLRML
jgi:hypothetical protein